MAAEERVGAPEDVPVGKMARPRRATRRGAFPPTAASARRCDVRALTTLLPPAIVRACRPSRRATHGAQQERAVVTLHARTTLGRQADGRRDRVAAGARVEGGEVQDQASGRETGGQGLEDKKDEGGETPDDARQKERGDGAQMAPASMSAFSYSCLRSPSPSMPSPASCAAAAAAVARTSCTNAGSQPARSVRTAFWSGER